MSGLVRALTWLLALFGAVLAWAVVAGRLPPELARRSLPHEPTTADEHAACCEAHPSAAPIVAAAGAIAATTPSVTTEPGRATGQRFTVCEREEARVSSTELRLRDDGPPLFAIGCGSSLHVLGFEHIGSSIEPRRLLELQLEPHSPAEAPHAIEALAADVDGDGRRDLVASVLLVDATAGPRGGAVFMSRQRADGGFDNARRLLELAPLDMAAGALDAVRGDDLVLLHGGDARVSRPNAVWLLTGGASPVRAAVREAGVGSRAVVACDLDGDGLDEVVEAGGEDGVLRLWPSGVTAAAEPVTLLGTQVRELACVRDGKEGRAVAVTGAQLALLHAPHGAQPELQLVEESENLRKLRTLDLDGDGAPELVGYAHPQLVAFIWRDERYERRVLASIEGQASVLDAQLAQLGGGAAPELVVLTVNGGAVELSVFADVAAGRAVELAAPSSARVLPSAALLQRINLR